MEKKEELRRAFYMEGKSIRQIQRETGHHRRTIRKALEDGFVPEYRRHIGDFTRWKEPDAYQSAFQRLLRNLQP